MGVEALIPRPLEYHYRRLRSMLKNRHLGRSNADVFDTIYRRSLWGRAENGHLYSGSGTYDPFVPTYIAFVLKFIADNNIESIVEIGCGDFAIGKHYASEVDRYLGVDVSKVVIDRNASFSVEGISFRCVDASQHDLPQADLCIVRQVFQHLDNGAIAQMLARTVLHKFLLVTEHLPAPSRLQAPNLNKRSGPDTRVTFGSGVYVEHAPFHRHGEIVLSLPVSRPQVGAGEVMRTTLLVNP